MVAAALPVLAAAQDAHGARQINVRAGPARDHALVACYGRGTPLAVQGCTDGYGWCDVIVPGGVRGEVLVGSVIYPFQDQERPLQMYGTVVGIRIIGFSIRSYWGSYYPSRSRFASRPLGDHAPPMRPGQPVMGAPRRPGGPRPPIGRPPGDNRPPPVMHPPPASRPPPVTRPPEGRPPEGRPPGGERPTGERRGNARRGEAPRPPER